MLTCFLLLVIGLLSGSPAVMLNDTPALDCCGSKKCPTPAHHPMACHGNTCNPFSVCNGGNFFISTELYDPLTTACLKDPNSLPSNDGSVVERSADCWHPPKTCYYISDIKFSIFNHHIWKRRYHSLPSYASCPHQQPMPAQGLIKNREPRQFVRKVVPRRVVATRALLVVNKQSIQANLTARHFCGGLFIL